MVYTNLMLVEFAERVLAKKTKYWYGTFGQTASTSLYNSKKSQYPSHYTSARASTYKQHISSGLKICDCVGLIKWFFWSNNGEYPVKYKTNGCPDASANSMYSSCKEKGSIKTLPEIPGLVLWCNGHIGIYIGGGYAIEARGFAYGVVKTKVSDRTWTNWGKIPYLTYTNEAPEVDSNPTLSIGSKGTKVKEMQIVLLVLGYNLPKYGADGDFGNETEWAIIKLQNDYGFDPTGICDINVWGALYGDLKPDNIEESEEPEDNENLDEETLEETNPTNPWPTPTGTLAYGAINDHVAWVQWTLVQLGYSVGTPGINGKFNTPTVEAVKRFQKDVFGKTNGDIGTQTLEALKKAIGQEDSEAEVEPEIPAITPPTTQKPDKERIIIDLSQHNNLTHKNNDWVKIAKNVDLIVFRCGVTRTSTSPIGIGKDCEFEYAAKKCIEHGIPFGVYYYLKFFDSVKSDADKIAHVKKEAQMAYNTAAKYNPLFYVADIEENRFTVASVRAFSEELQRLGAKKIGIYIGQSWYPKLKNAFDKYHFLWIPRYGENNGKVDKKPIYDCAIHQYTSVGDGIKYGLADNTIDMNILNGNKTFEWFLNRDVIK